MIAITAEHCCQVMKTETQKAFLYGVMGDDIVCYWTQDWWPEPIPEGHSLHLVKSVYCTQQAARRLRWHNYIPE
jgi:hypothetical protein